MPVPSVRGGEAVAAGPAACPATPQGLSSTCSLFTLCLQKRSATELLDGVLEALRESIRETGGVLFYQPGETG